MSTKYSPAYRQGNLFRPEKKGYEEVPDDTARYRALSGLAIASLGFGVLSLLAFAGWSLALVPMTAIVLGWLALRKIDRNPEETAGRSMAWAGIGLALMFWASGYGWLIFQHYFRVPAGYVRVENEELQPNPNDPEEVVPERARDLDGRKVFVRGFMLPTRQKSGIREFVMINDPGGCSFCNPKPKPTELIRVKLAGGLVADFTTRFIDVGGVFTVHTDPKDLMAGNIYEIEADFLR